jgi:hypothetical protein
MSLGAPNSMKPQKVNSKEKRKYDTVYLGIIVKKKRERGERREREQLNEDKNYSTNRFSFFKSREFLLSVG